ncbi:hypothetical protein FHP29_08920 [Nocardioides albidus]|uniref:Uncharacterized protein n=2 Tax=Nocardioides albidus TaxID=1517589 RepID=A0A5C4VZ97_9ACTN|nr:hypothetical protein FHP29_08920 [Nocardioides albidus]
MIGELITAILPLSSDDGAIWLLAAGPAGGVATYWAVHRYYRNTDKSHHFERDTIIEGQPVQGGEDKVGHISKTRDSGIDGDNSGNFRQRVQRVQ